MSEDPASNAADANKPAVEKTFMSDSDYLARRTASLSGQKPAEQSAAPQPELKAEAEPTAEAPEEKAKEDDNKSAPEAEPKEAEAKEVLSKVDLSELSDDDIRELAEKGKSGLLKRIAELTAKRRLAEEKAAQLEAAIRQQPQAQLESKPTDLPEDIAKVSSVEDLNKLYQTATEYIEWAEDTLFTNDHLGADDLIAEHGGKQYTKKDVKALLGLARKNRDKFLPTRLKQLQEAEQRRVERDAYAQRMRQEIPWIDGEDNDLRRRFEAINKSPVLEKVRKSVPEAEPILDYMVAHAVNSAYGRREIKDAFAPPAPKINPPSINPGASAASERPDAKPDKALKGVQERFRTTGSERDFVALRTAQMGSKRKNQA